MIEYIISQGMSSTIMMSIITLVILSLMDIKTKKIAIPMIGIVSVYGLINQLLSAQSIKHTICNILITIVLTALFLVITYVTKEQLGMGDGFVFLMLALLNSWYMAISIYLVAFMLTGFVGLFIIAFCHKARKMTIPFIPFVTMTYLVFVFVR
ncbi:MAG: prepilin peptidase [Vallitaleaceae bacterium]|jgi:leader peptidase (prepilin peptidase)/N-methyltransferase|nr:prepilin peptidase [Vallitaleaceae bacterium]